MHSLAARRRRIRWWGCSTSTTEVRRERRLGTESLERRRLLAADLGITLAIDSPLQAGEIGTLRVEVTNHGDTDATGALATVLIPDSFDLTQLDGTAVDSFFLEGRQLQVQLGDLAATQVAELMLKGSITPSTVGALAFTGIAWSESPESNLADNLASIIEDVATGTVALPAPEGVDLEGATDSGTRNDDNITNSTVLSFRVSGVQVGATVDLLVDGTVMASQIAGSGEEVIVLDETLLPADGQFIVTARQQLETATSSTTPPLLVRIDRTTPVTAASPLPTNVLPNEPIEADYGHPEERAGLQYELIEGPVTATIDATTGLFQWTPSGAETGVHPITVRIRDTAGNAIDVTDQIMVGTDFDAGFQLVLRDLQGNPPDQLQVGDTFDIDIFALDLRPGMALGVFAAYLDLAFDPAVVEAVGPIPHTFGAGFSNARSGDDATPALIDELGAFHAQLSPTNETAPLLATVRMRVIGGGETAIVARAATGVGHDFGLYGQDTGVPPERVHFDTVPLSTTDAFLAVRDHALVHEDTVGTLPVTMNDRHGPNPPIQIVAVQTPTSGTATISGDGLAIEYQPADDASGIVSFSYTIADASNQQSTAFVTVAVVPTNDPPAAVNDVFVVEANAFELPLDVLANDSVAPESDDQLQIDSVGSGNAGGTLTIDSANQQLRYTPAAGFRGRETFSYTVRDRLGATATATITLNVVSERSRWQNTGLPEDVDGNGTVQPIDALLVINDLNRSGTTDLVVDRLDESPPPFYDVDGNEFIAPLDALRVINFLNKFGVGGAEPTGAEAILSLDRDVALVLPAPPEKRQTEPPEMVDLSNLSQFERRTTQL